MNVCHSVLSFVYCVRVDKNNVYLTNPLCSWTILSIISSWRLSVEVLFVCTMTVTVIHHATNYTSSMISVISWIYIYN